MSSARHIQISGVCATMKDMVKSLTKIQPHLETITIESEVKERVPGAVPPRFVRLSDPWLQFAPVKSEKKPEPH